ncbi:MAG TPA: PTS sugar transporter subunit IIC [Erysipelothrix sp.]|nr:PTS sugar transporter subunit IIC [Erysipelothrix sp.]
MEIQVWQSLAIAIWVALVQSRAFFGLATLTLRFSPMMTGLVVGVVMGDIANAMMITATIQLFYMGVFAPGGQMPSEPAVAAAIAVPVALMSGLSPEESVGIAVPVGLLGGYLYQFRFFLNTFVGKLWDTHAANANDSGLTRSIILYPFLISLAIYIPFMFITLQYGAPLIASFVEANASSRLFHVLTVIGGGLAAIGIGVSVYVIGKKDYLVFFFLAYFLAVALKDLQIMMVVWAILGALLAMIFVLVKNEAVDASGQ